MICIKYKGMYAICWHANFSTNLNTMDGDDILGGCIFGPSSDIATICVPHSHITLQMIVQRPCMEGMNVLSTRCIISVSMKDIFD